MLDELSAPTDIILSTNELLHHTLMRIEITHEQTPLVSMACIFICGKIWWDTHGYISLRRISIGYWQAVYCLEEYKIQDLEYDEMGKKNLCNRVFELEHQIIIAWGFDFSIFNSIEKWTKLPDVLKRLDITESTGDEIKAYIVKPIFGFSKYVCYDDVKLVVVAILLIVQSDHSESDLKNWATSLKIDKTKALEIAEDMKIENEKFYNEIQPRIESLKSRKRRLQSPAVQTMQSPVSGITSTMSVTDDDGFRSGKNSILCQESIAGRSTQSHMIRMDDEDIKPSEDYGNPNPIEKEEYSDIKPIDDIKDNQFKTYDATQETRNGPNLFVIPSIQEISSGMSYAKAITPPPEIDIPKPPGNLDENEAFDIDRNGAKRRYSMGSEYDKHQSQYNSYKRPRTTGRYHNNDHNSRRNSAHEQYDHYEKARERRSSIDSSHYQSNSYSQSSSQTRYQSIPSQSQYTQENREYRRYGDFSNLPSYDYSNRRGYNEVYRPQTARAYIVVGSSYHTSDRHDSNRYRNYHNFNDRSRGYRDDSSSRSRSDHARQQIRPEKSTISNLVENVDTKTEQYKNISVDNHVNKIDREDGEVD